MKRNAKKIFTLLLACVMLLSVLSACNGANGSESTNNTETQADPDSTVGGVSEAIGAVQKEGFVADTVTVASGDPMSFTPLRQTGNTGKAILNEIYESLVDLDGAGGEVYGNLAKDWYWDGTDLYFELYDYIYDSNGNNITASDVVFSYQASWDAGYTTNKFGTFCDGAEAVDTYTVVFHWKEDQMDVYNAFASLGTGQYIFSQAEFEASADEMATSPVGTGPYVLDDMVSGSSVTLKRRDDYWQTDTSLIGRQHVANVETINYKFISDPTQQVNALRSGEIDYVNGITQEAYDMLSASDEFTVYGAYNKTLFAVWMNCIEGSPLSDINMRAAICYAMNSDDVLGAVGGEEFARKIYEFCCPDTTGYNTNCESWDNYYNTYDVDLAKDYLSKCSDYADHVYQIYYFSGEEPTYNEAISLCLGATLDVLGLKYEIHPVSVIDDVFAEPNADWDFCVLTTGGDGGAADYLRTYLDSTRYEGCVGNFYDETLDEMYKRIYTQSGATEEGIEEINQYLIDNYYIYGMFERLVYDCWRTDLVEDASIKTKRCWVIPGSWVYMSE